jgi:hypothetical protein
MLLARLEQSPPDGASFGHARGSRKLKNPHFFGGFGPEAR